MMIPSVQLQLVRRDTYTASGRLSFAVGSVPAEP
jgi:hypothetical protein